MTHPNGCPVCQVMTLARRWSNVQMPGFLQRQSKWIQGEYQKYLARGIDKHRMRISVDCEGTMYFLIDNRKITMYSINY